MRVKDFIKLVGGWTFVKIVQNDDEENAFYVGYYALTEKAYKNRLHLNEIVRRSVISIDEDFDIILTIYI